jgi:hypothetical protein
MFTILDAFEARDAGTPIMLDHDTVCAVLEHHGHDTYGTDVLDDLAKFCGTPESCRQAADDAIGLLDAATVLDFLGY